MTKKVKVYIYTSPLPVTGRLREKRTTVVSPLPG